MRTEGQGGVSLLVPELTELSAAVEGDAALRRVLGCEIAEGWCGFPDALRDTRDTVARHPTLTAWGTRFFVLGEPPVLVGWGGFKGPPEHGGVELGYEIAPGFRGRGLATQAVSAMLGEALADPRVAVVRAHTAAERGPSVRVLEKAGFAWEREVADPEGGPLWRFRLDREAGGRAASS